MVNSAYEDIQDRSKYIFGNPVSPKAYRKACASKEKYIKKFGDDSGVAYHLEADIPPVIGSCFGVRRLRLAGGTTETAQKDQKFDIVRDAKIHGCGKPLVIGNIRMGFGHYRIAMAFASAAHALGYTPYWFDLCGFDGTTCSKVIAYQNKLYSMGSRLSQKVELFNRLYWEPLNSEGFRMLDYNASDQKNAELFVSVYGDLPKDIPFIATHVWPAQGAIHAGLTNVVNAIPDNWPMALHLAEGSTHMVQTPGATLGYQTLRGMAGAEVLKPMPEGTCICSGHYIDHELVVNIPADCDARKERLLSGEPVRYLLTLGGAGAQVGMYKAIIEHLVSYVNKREAVLMLNVGDHQETLQELLGSIPDSAVRYYQNDFESAEKLVQQTLSDTPLEGIHAFYDSDIFSAVYTTNLFMRICDVLVTKPSELAFYPVPKLMLRRVGGHEAWGAIRAAELGDGTYELRETSEILGMIDNFQQNRTLITTMCDAICANNTQEIYNGAYNVVKQATEKTG